jgi:hypothetical protein
MLTMLSAFRAKDRLLKSLPELQIHATQLARDGSPPPGLRLPHAKLSRNSNQIARGRICRFESDMPSHAVDRHCRPASPPLGFLPSPVGSDKMRNLLAEYPAWFEPDEVQILVGAFDKAWETVQAIGVVYAEAKAEAVRTILAKHNY